jgi:hypothetical protein
MPLSVTQNQENLKPQSSLNKMTSKWKIPEVTNLISDVFLFLTQVMQFPWLFLYKLHPSLILLLPKFAIELYNEFKKIKKSPWYASPGDLSSFLIQQISKIYDDIHTGYRVSKITHIVEITHIIFWPLMFRDPEEILIQKIYTGKSPTVYRSD